MKVDHKSLMEHEFGKEIIEPDLLMADGLWHNVFQTPLKGCNAFEILAFSRGEQNKGRYAMLHAIALSTFGSNSKSQITKTAAHYGHSWNKLEIKWESRKGLIQNPNPSKLLDRLRFKFQSNSRQYQLQIRTRSNYGDKGYIRVRLRPLWENTENN